MERIFAIVPAAGSSTRMSSAVPKVLLPLGGISIIRRSVELLSEAVSISGMAVLAPENAKDLITQELQDVSGSVYVMLGGDSRANSVRVGVNFLMEHYRPSPEDLVVVHDAARCLCSKDLVRSVIDEARLTGCAVAAVPIADTLVRANNGERVSEYVNRDGMWAIQTPQVFKFNIIEKALERGYPGATDESSQVFPFHSVNLVLGERSNIKITYPEDYDLANAIILKKR